MGLAEELDQLRRENKELKDEIKYLKLSIDNQIRSNLTDVESILKGLSLEEKELVLKEDTTTTNLEYIELVKHLSEVNSRK